MNLKQKLTRLIKESLANKLSEYDTSGLHSPHIANDGQFDDDDYEDDEIGDTDDDSVNKSLNKDINVVQSVLGAIHNEGIQKFNKKDNLYKQLHDKYADTIKDLKAKKIKKLTDLVSVQRWALEKLMFDDNNPISDSDKKKMIAMFKNERKLFKQYVGGNTKVSLTEQVLTEGVNEARAPKTKSELENAIKDAERKLEKHSNSLMKLDNAPGGGNWSSNSKEGKAERKLKNAQGKLRDDIDRWNKKLKTVTEGKPITMGKDVFDVIKKSSGIWLMNKKNKDDKYGFKTEKQLNAFLDDYTEPIKGRQSSYFGEAVNEQVLTEGVNDPNILKAVFLAGGPGSGKSFSAEQVFGIDNIMKGTSTLGLKVVNSDPAFEQELKKRGVDPKDLGKMTERLKK
jgi:hypothetical protein